MAARLASTYDATTIDSIQKQFGVRILSFIPGGRQRAIMDDAAAALPELVTYLDVPGAGSRLSSFVAKHLRLQASTRHGGVCVSIDCNPQRVCLVLQQQRLRARRLSQPPLVLCRNGSCDGCAGSRLIELAKHERRRQALRRHWRSEWPLFPQRAPKSTPPKRPPQCLNTYFPFDTSLLWLTGNRTLGT